MIIQQFTKPAKTINEDAVFACEKFAFVLDGATGLLKENISPLASDASWFTKEFKQYFIDNLGDFKKTLNEIVCNGIIYVNKKYNSFEGAEKIKTKPSSGLALYRINNDKLEYFILGDCSLIVKNKSNQITHLKIDDLPKLDEKNIKKMYELAKEKNINVIDARELINDDLIQTRSLQNTDDGYWILSDNVDAINHAFTGSFQLNSLQQIVGMSDGFSQIFDTFNIYNLNDFINLLSSGTKIETIYKTLFDAQEKDIFCNQFPRFKLRDDTTIFNIIL